MIVVNGFVKSD